jgi:hypothetical protein
MICWYCHWGWPKRIADIYAESIARLKTIGETSEALSFSDAHVVWADENFHSAEFCLEELDKNKNEYSQELYDILRWGLQELIKLPPELLDVWPEEYDSSDDKPEDYPPPANVEMVPIEMIWALENSIQFKIL